METKAPALFVASVATFGQKEMGAATSMLWHNNQNGFFLIWGEGMGTIIHFTQAHCEKEKRHRGRGNPLKTTCSEWD